MTRRRGGPALIGLDIGSSEVKVAQLVFGAVRPRLRALGVEPLPVRGSADADASIVSGAVRRLWDRLGVTRGDVAVALSGHGVFVKQLSVPSVGEGELHESIEWEARRHIPFDLDDVRFDYHVGGGPSATRRGEATTAILVAARKERVDACVSIVSRAGCTARVVDVDAFALQNAYEINYHDYQDDVAVLVNAGARCTNLNVVQGGESRFSRDVAMGGHAYTAALQTELGLPFDDAELVKKGVPLGDVTYEAAEPVVTAVTQTLLQEISKTLDFCRATIGLRGFDRIVLSGGTSRIDGMTDAFADRFQAHVELFDPFRRIGIEHLGLSGDQRLQLGAVVPVAVGLATRRRHDR